MKHLLVLAWLLLGLGACESEDLSLGAVRCISTRCDSRTSVAKRDDEYVAAEHVMLDQPEGARVVELWCPLSYATCSDFHIEAALLERDGETSVLVAATPHPEGSLLEHLGSWLGRYVKGELVWHSEEPVHRSENYDAAWYLNVAVAADAPQEAVVVASQRHDDEHNNSVWEAFAYHLDERDRVTSLFRVETITFARDVALVGDDVLLVTELDEENAELTRYTRAGEIVWRQSALASTSTSMDDSIVFAPPIIKILGDGRIAVLFSRSHKGYELALVDPDSGNVTLSYAVRTGEGARHVMLLEPMPEGRLALAAEAYQGYQLDELDSERLFSREVRRARTAYYDLDLYGLAAGNSGTVYLLTQDGAMSDRRLVLDRISPSFELIESIDYTAVGTDCDTLGIDTDVHVDSDERTAFITTHKCVIEIDLP